MKTKMKQAVVLSRALIVVVIALEGYDAPAASGQTSISFNDQRMTTTAPTPPSMPCILPPAASSFLTTDTTIYLYFNAIVTNADTLSMTWIAPNGDVLTGPTWPTSTGKFCYGAALNISNPKPGHYGAWQAQVYDRYALLFSVPFTVNAPGPLAITAATTTEALPNVLGRPTNYCAVPTTVTSFRTTDRTVNVWFTFDKGSTGDVLTINWIHPSGAVDASRPTTTLSSGGSYCFEYGLAIVNSEPATEPGTWHVVLLVNGSQVFSLPFTLTGPAVTNEVLTGTNPFANDTCAVPVPKTNFLTWDQDVQFWFAFEHLSAGDKFTINWIHPSGMVDAQHQLYGMSTGAGSGCAGGILLIKGNEAAAETGIWNVSVLINGSVVSRVPFVIAAPGATIISPPPGSNLSGDTVTFSWTAVPGATDYVLCLASTSGGSDFGCGSVGLATSATRRDVPTLGRTLYVGVTAQLGSNVAITGATYNEAYIENVGAVLTFPAVTGPAYTVGSFEPPMILQWSIVPGTVYLLTVGTTRPGSSNLVSIQGPRNTYTFSYPDNGETLYVELRTIYPDAVSVSNAYTFRAPSSGGSGGSGSGGSSSGGAGSGGSGSGGSGSGGSGGGWAGSGLVSGLTCVNAYYDPDNNNFLTFVNDCSEGVAIEVFGNPLGFAPANILFPGGTSWVGFTSDDNPSYYVCPIDDQPVDQYNNAVMQGGLQYSCAPD